MSETTPAETTPVVIDVWSDVACPFCYLGDAQLAAAIAELPVSDAVTLRYHSYQLSPELTENDQVPLREMLMKRKGLSAEQVEAMNAQFGPKGAAYGLEFNFDDAIGTSTAAAHEFSHFAASKNKQHEAMLELFQAYFTDGKLVSDPNELAAIAERIGLSKEETLAALADGSHREAVAEDIRTATELGINGVPFYIFNGKFAVSGAQGEDTFAKALGMCLADHQNSASE